MAELIAEYSPPMPIPAMNRVASIWTRPPSAASPATPAPGPGLTRPSRRWPWPTLARSGALMTNWSQRSGPPGHRGHRLARPGTAAGSYPADARGAEHQVVLLDRPDQGARRLYRLDPDRGRLAAAGRQRLPADPHGLADRTAGVAVDQQQRAAEPSGVGQPRHHGGAEALHRVLDPRGVHVHPGQPEPRRGVQRRLPLVDRNPVALDAHRAHGPAHHVGAPGRGHLLGMD